MAKRNLNNQSLSTPPVPTMMPDPDDSSSAEADTNQNGPQAQQTSCTKKPIFLGSSNLPDGTSKGNVTSNPGTEDILSAMAHNIEVLAETMQSKGQDSAEDKAELDERRATLEETRRIHEENDRFRIDRFLLASAAQDVVATQEGSDAHGSSTHSGTSSGATSSASQQPHSQHQAQTQHADLGSDDLARLSSAGFLDAPCMTPEAEKQDVIALSTEAEYARTYTDVFGKKPATVTDLEKILDGVDSELAKLPQEEMIALNRARDALPMLCLSSRHTMIFLQATGFKPGPAAKQMARYWSKRVALYGDDAFSPGNLSLPSNEDLIRMYDKAYAALYFDPDADEEKRVLAATFVERFHHLKLAALAKELESYPIERRESYLKAKELCPGRISDIDFLQSTNFNVKDAAERICNYFQLYDELFGRDGTFLPIAQGSFGDEQLSDLYLGFCRVMPGTDRHGRAIIFFDVSKLQKGGYSDRGILKSVFYAVNVIAKDNIEAYHGLVMLSNHRGCEASHYSFGLMKRLASIMLSTAPLKIKAAHRLKPQKADWQRAIISKIDYFLGRLMRFRTVQHVSSIEEFVVEAEARYGISKDVLPEEMGGTVSLEAWRRWLRVREELEQIEGDI